MQSDDERERGCADERDQLPSMQADSRPGEATERAAASSSDRVQSGRTYEHWSGRQPYIAKRLGTAGRHERMAGEREDTRERVQRQPADRVLQDLQWSLLSALQGRGGRTGFLGQLSKL